MRAREVRTSFETLICTALTVLSLQLQHERSVILMAQAIEMEMPDTQSTLRWVCIHHVGRPRRIDGMTKRIICALNHAFELKASARMNDIMHLQQGSEEGE